MTRKTVTLVGLLVVAACASAQLLLDKGPDAGRLEVRVEGIEHEDGSMRFALFATPDGFPSDPASAEVVETLDVSDSVMTWTLEDVATGLWAVAVLHDEDADAEMATDWLGRPSEGWGVSNDARGSFGPPSFEDASFEVVAAGTSIVIHLDY
jgi:uncharacterized protein (DUF2141 family)